MTQQNKFLRIQRHLDKSDAEGSIEDLQRLWELSWIESFKAHDAQHFPLKIGEFSRDGILEISEGPRGEPLYRFFEGDTQLMVGKIRTDVLPVDEREAVDNASKPAPPTNAEYVLHLLLTGEDRDAVIGDLIERYPSMLDRFGRRKANLWFYWQGFCSFWPLLKRVLFASLGEWVRRHVS